MWRTLSLAQCQLGLAPAPFDPLKDKQAYIMDEWKKPPQKNHLFPNLTFILSTVHPYLPFDLKQIFEVPQRDRDYIPNRRDCHNLFLYTLFESPPRHTVAVCVHVCILACINNSAILVTTNNRGRINRAHPPHNYTYECAKSVSPAMSNKRQLN